MRSFNKASFRVCVCVVHLLEIIAAGHGIDFRKSTAILSHEKNHQIADALAASQTNGFVIRFAGYYYNPFSCYSD